MQAFSSHSIMLLSTFIYINDVSFIQLLMSDYTNACTCILHEPLRYVLRVLFYDVLWIVSSLKLTICFKSYIMLGNRLTYSSYCMITLHLFAMLEIPVEYCNPHILTPGISATTPDYTYAARDDRHFG